MGGGRPPQPPRFFSTMHGFQENRTINKNCVKHVVVMACFKFIIQAVCLQMRGLQNGGGGCPPQPPRFFFRHADWFSRTQNP